MKSEAMCERLVKLLKDNGLTLAAAESCTGGAFMADLVKVPGVSEVFRGGMVTYSDDVKVELVGVKRETIKKFGVVSTHVAAEMAAGVRAKLGADIGVSVTGYAGPGGEDVGKVYFGIAVKDNQYTSVKKFVGMTRREVIDASVNYLVEWLCEKV